MIEVREVDSRGYKPWFEDWREYYATVCRMPYDFGHAKIGSKGSHIEIVEFDNGGIPYEWR